MPSRARPKPLAARLALAAAALALAGCAELLPKTASEVTSPWKSFDDAKTAIERIEPGRTTLADLRLLDIDLYTNPNVQLLNYSDIVLRFPMNWEGARRRSPAGASTRCCS